MEKTCTEYTTCINTQTIRAHVRSTAQKLHNQQTLPETQSDLVSNWKWFIMPLPHISNCTVSQDGA